MSSTVGSRYEAGTLTSDLSENLDVRKIQFKPRRVVVNNLSNNIQVEWNDSLVSGRMVKTASDGTRSVVASGGIAPLDPDSDGNPGFRIPAGLADINDADGEELSWQVWE